MADKHDTPENPEHGATGVNDGKRRTHKTSHKVMVVAGLAAIIGTAAYIGSAQSSGWGSYGYGHGDGYGYGHGGYGYMQQMFEEFDSDGDGKLTTAEVTAARISRFNGADNNKDSSLSIEEFQGLWLDHMRPRMVDKFQMLDEDGDGRVTGEEFSQPFAMMMRHMDHNNDGALEMREMQKMHRGWGDHEDDDDRYERDDDKG